jgi:hypothetical protein
LRASTKANTEAKLEIQSLEALVEELSVDASPRPDTRDKIIQELTDEIKHKEAEVAELCAINEELRQAEDPRQSCTEPKYISRPASRTVTIPEDGMVETQSSDEDKGINNEDIEVSVRQSPDEPNSLACELAACDSSGGEDFMDSDGHYPDTSDNRDGLIAGKEKHDLPDKQSGSYARKKPKFVGVEQTPRGRKKLMSYREKRVRGKRHATATKPPILQDSKLYVLPTTPFDFAYSCGSLAEGPDTHKIADRSLDAGHTSAGTYAVEQESSE